MARNPQQNTDKWDHRFLDLCFHVAQWSKDPRTKVGAVLVGLNRRQIVLGYNGPPARIEDSHDRLHNRELKHRIVRHAEENAIFIACRDLQGYTLYCSLPPCIRCTCEIIQAEILRVVHPVLTEEQKILHENYKEDWDLCEDLLKEAGVDLTKLHRG